MAHRNLSGVFRGTCPQDLIELILGKTDSADKETLESCALVARSFRPTSQKLSDIVPVILSMFTNLESLNVRIYNWAYFHSNCEHAIYTLITRSSLSSITLEEARLTTARLLSFLRSLPTSLESASFLNLFADDWYGDDLDSASSELHRLRLTSLHLNSYAPMLFRWAIRAVDLKHLRHLHTTVEEDAMDIAQELLDGAVYVETYHLTFRSIFSHPENPDLSKMQHLRTFEISVELDWEEIEEVGGQGRHNPLNDAIRTLYTVPHTVEHLILNLSIWNPRVVVDPLEPIYKPRIDTIHTGDIPCPTTESRCAPQRISLHFPCSTTQPRRNNGRRQPKLFKGDSVGENATDFLNSMRRRNLLSPGWKDDEKLEFFELCLKSGSFAKNWFNKLKAGEKDTFAHLAAAFQKQWPEKEMAEKEKGEVQEELLGLVLDPSDVGVRVEEDGIQEWGHVRWALKVAELGARVDDEGGLIPQALKNIPDSLLLRLGPKRGTWPELVQSMKDIPSSDIASVRHQEERFIAMETQLTAAKATISAMQQTPTRGLSNAFAGMAASSPVRNDPIRRNLTSAFTNAAPNPTDSARAPFRCPDAERLRKITATPAVIHPRTTAGLAACGIMGHFATRCTAPANLRVPELETKWRQIAQSIRSRAERDARPATAINIVADADDTEGRDVFGTAEYDQSVIEDYLRREGKGSGPSN
ncbi:hypothetical protein B0H11DRAFT_2365126 [Mycena galericulata]|nr:hypothetical protein B0H11DRAFT_2365126 [Mycena galericulata]